MKAVKDIKIKEQLDINIKAPIFIESPNAITGDKNFLYYSLKESIKKAEAIDIIVSFLMESGVKLILEDLKEAVSRGVKIRILTGNYLRITEPSALYLLKGELGDKIDLRFYNVPSKSFHPKSYIFHNQEDSEIYLGSSNLSRGALTASIEWNYRFLKSQNPKDFNVFYKTFEDLFYNHSLYGPLYGIVTGVLGSLISGFTYDIYSIYFSPVQIIIGGIVGYLAKKDGFKGKKLFCNLLILTIPTGIVGAIIAYYLFDGVTSSGSSYLVQILTFLGFSKKFIIFLIQFITDYMDKFLAIKLIILVLKKLPSNIKEKVS